MEFICLKVIFHELEDQQIVDRMVSLTQYEKKEISKYFKRGIYYTGVRTSKVYAEDIEDYYDAYNFYLATPYDHIYYRYMVYEELGRGVFGLVVKVKDMKTLRFKAIKIYKRKRGVTDLVKNEIAIYKATNAMNCNKIIHYERYLIFRQHNMIVMELLNEDLNTYINERKNKQRPLKISVVRNIVRCLTEALVVLHDKQVVHTDLKLDNVMFVDSSRTGNVKLIDLGCCRHINDLKNKTVQPIRFRAPEVVFLGFAIDTSIDMWNLGCLIFKLLTGQSLFYVNTEEGLISQIVKTLGLPQPRLVMTWYGTTQRCYPYFELNGLPTPTVRYSPTDQILSIDKRLSAYDPDCVNFIIDCVQWDPRKRLTARKALEHKFLKL